MHHDVMGCRIGTSLTAVSALAAESVRPAYAAQDRLIEVERTVAASTTDDAHARGNNRKPVKVAGVID